MASQPVELAPPISCANREASNNLNVHQLGARTTQKPANIQLCSWKLSWRNWVLLMIQWFVPFFSAKGSND